VSTRGRVRLLFVNGTSEIGGADADLLEICRHLDAQRFEITVVLPSRGPLCAAFEAAGASLVYLDSVPLKRFRRAAQWFLYPARFLVGTARLIRCMVGVKPEIVHVNSLTVPAAALAARLSGVPCVWHVREIEQLRRSRLVGTVLRMWVRLCADRVVAPSHAVVINLGRIDPSRVHVIPHGVDDARFLPGPVNAEMRRQLGIPLSAEVVGFVGRFVPLKGLLHLVDAFAVVSSRLPDAWLLLAGPTDGFEDYVALVRKRIDQLGLASRVVVQTDHLDAAAVFRALDVSVLPSTSPEGFGLVVIESLASGRPVVATRLGGPVEILEGCAAGRLVPPADAAAMAQAILDLLDQSPDERQSLAVGARRWAVERFGMRRMIDQLAEVYESLLSGHVGAPSGDRRSTGATLIRDRGILACIKILVVLGSAISAGWFALHANAADLGFRLESALASFNVDALHDTNLVNRENVEITAEKHYYVPAYSQPGWLLYRIESAYPIRYGRLAIIGWNNKSFRVSWSRDGRQFQNIDWVPPLTGFDTTVTLDRVPPDTRQLYLRIDMAADRLTGQTNLYALRASFVLDPPVITPERVTKSLLLAFAVLLEWLLYSRVVAKLSRVTLGTAGLDDAVAHWPLLALLIARPLAQVTSTNVTASTLVYAVLAFLSVRLYQLIRRADLAGRERLVGVVLMGVLILSSVLYVRMITGDGDGTVYYALPRSLVIDRDLDFANEFEHANKVVGIGMPIERIPTTGVIPYPYPIATGLAQLPFVAAAHMATRLARYGGIALALDGYSAFYSAFVAAGSVLCSFFALCLAVRTLIPVVGRTFALLGSLTVWLGTSGFSMVYLHPSHSHGLDLLVVGAFFYAWFRGRQRVEGRHWLLMGLLFGLCAMVREQNLVLVALPAFDVVRFWEKEWHRGAAISKTTRTIVTTAAAGCLGFVCGYLPQMIFNFIQSGAPLRSAYARVPFSWFHPKIGPVLYGSEHGLLYWTPLTLMGFAGIVLLLRQDWRRWGGVALVIFATIYQIGAFGLFGGAGAGMRYFINMSVPMALGSAVASRAIAARIGLKTSALICGFGILLNLWLVSAYALGVLPEMGRGVTAPTFLQAVVVEGPKRTIDFLDGITYFRKKAPAIGATLFRATLGDADPPWVIAAALSLFIIVAGGWIIQRMVLRAVDATAGTRGENSELVRPVGRAAESEIYPDPLEA
jgi:glycosyltransferase involved in cell wall biosynthesis